MKIEVNEGVVTKDGEKIGIYNAETNVFLADRQLAPQEKGAINKALETKAKFDIVPENPENANPEPSTEQPAEKKGKAKGDIPEAPAKSARFGDLTPEYVEWMKTYHPEKAAKQYKGRIPGF